MKRLLGNTVVQIVGKAVMVLLSLITTGILTRKLGVESYGSFILVTSLFVFLDALADFGAKIIGVREVSKGEKGVMGEVIQLKGITTLIAWLLGLGAIWGFEAFRNLRWEATVALTMVWLTAAGSVGEIVFQSQLKMAKKVVIDIIFPLLFLGALVFYKGTVGLMWVFGVYLAARLVSITVGWQFLKNAKEIREIKWTWDKNKLKKLWKETWPMGIFLIVFAAYDRMVDSLMIQNFLGAESTAYYGLAYKVYAVMIQPAYFYVNSVFPILSSKAEGKRKIFGVSLGILLAAVAGVIGIVTVLAPWIINVLAGSQYEPAAGVLRVLIWGCLFSYVGHLLGFSLIAKGGQGEMLKLGLAALIFNVVMNIILIPRFGIIGAAGVTVMTEALDMFLMGWFLWKKRK